MSISTGVQGLTGLQVARLSPPPIRTPHQEGAKSLTHPWERWYSDLYNKVTAIIGGIIIGSTGIGATGMPGVQGVTGTPGVNGVTGAPGIQGLDGQTGTQGLANFVEDGYPSITTTPVFLWNEPDEALFVGVTGIDHWVQVGAGVQGVTGTQGLTGLALGSTGIIGVTGIRGLTGIQGLTGIKGFTGLANFWDLASYPAVGAPPVLLWNENDEALFAGMTGINKWVQISAGSVRGATGVGGTSVPRVTSIITDSTAIPNADVCDLYCVTALAQSLYFSQPIGSPNNGQILNIRIKDNNSVQTLNFNPSYNGVGLSLPTVTVATKYLYVGSIYNSQSGQWDVLATGQE